jgi:ribonuclease T2
MLAIMPVPGWWLTVGSARTCSGLSPEDYFKKAAQAFNSVNIPQRYKAPLRQITVSPDQLRHDFALANPTLGDQGLVVLCSGNGRYLQEVRACLTKDLQGRPCTADVLRGACKSDQIIMRPLR